MISLRDVVTGFGNRDPLAEIWRRDLRGGGGGGSAVITGVPPLRFIGYGRPLTDYLISGNTVQDGTPSPDAPVDAVGCGAWDETHQSYKIPLTVNGTEYPIYLGQVETMRRVRKIVFTGNENLGVSGTAVLLYFITLPPDQYAMRLTDTILYDFGGRIEARPVPYASRIQFSFDGGALTTTIEEVKAYLAYQYTSGTPVTCWYVLAEPETAVVNEPLMKIGDYADTVSFAQAGVTIPTVSGENVLDVPTDVKPSEVTIKGGISSV